MAIEVLNHLSDPDDVSHNSDLEDPPGDAGRSSSSTSYSSSSISDSSDIFSDRCSRLAAVFLMVNATLGAGVLNFPQAFDQAGGITVALIVQLVLVTCVFFGLIILGYSSWFGQSTTLQDTLAYTCGRKGSLVCSILVALYCFGSCITYLIIIGDQFDRVFLSVVGPQFCSSWRMNRKFTITYSAVVFILPMCYTRKIESLKYASSVGLIAVLYVVCLVAAFYYKGNFVPGPIKTGPGHWTDVFYVVPVICFGYQSHVSIIPIYSRMDDRRSSSFVLVVFASLLLCVAAYTITAVYGYLTFGSLVAADILENYGGVNTAVLAGVVAIAVKSCTTYPIMLLCGRDAVSKVWCDLLDLDPCRRRVCRRFVISSLWFALTLILAIYSPGIGIVIDALGSLAAVFVFVLPGLCLLQTCSQSDSFFMSMKSRFFVSVAVLFVAVGAFIVGVVLVQTFQRALHMSPTPYLCT